MGTYDLLDAGTLLLQGKMTRISDIKRKVDGVTWLDCRSGVDRDDFERRKSSMFYLYWDTRRNYHGIIHYMSEWLLIRKSRATTFIWYWIRSGTGNSRDWVWFIIGSLAMIPIYYMQSGRRLRYGYGSSALQHS